MSFYPSNNNAEHYQQCEVFDDGLHHPFEMEDDYGFYEDLEDDSLPSQSPSDEDSASNPCTRIEDELPGSLESSPPILTASMVDCIVEAIPWSMQDMKWNRLYASSRDGKSFGTFMRKVRGHSQTIVVAKTSEGKIAGAYATDSWSGRKSTNSNTTHAFLFAVPPSAKKVASTPWAYRSSQAPFGTFIPGLEELSTSPTSTLDFELAMSSKHDEQGLVEIFKPQANTGLKQVCQLGNKFISLGDGENLSFSIENSFSHGSTSTQPANDKEEFDIVDFEVYGFSEE